MKDTTTKKDHSADQQYDERGFRTGTDSQRNKTAGAKGGEASRSRDQGMNQNSSSDQRGRVRDSRLDTE